MSRTIVTARDIRLAGARARAVPQVAGAARPEPPPPGQPNDYLTKLMKYIPGEVVSLYVALEAVLKTSVHNPAEAQGPYWSIFVVCVIGTPLYLWRLGGVNKILQLFISTVALAVWVFALGGPFESLAWYQTHKLYAALVLPIYTFLVAVIDP